MSDAGDVSRDPNFRNQYDGPVKPDAEFEAALCGQSAPIHIRQAPQYPGAQTQFGQFPPMVRLR